MQDIFSFLFESRAGLAVLFFGGLAVAAIVGIVVNAILPGKDYDFQNNYEYGKTTEDHGQML